MKRTLFILAFAIAASPTFAAPRTKTYPGRCYRVWAAVKAATAPPHYNFAMLDDAQKKGIVSTGSGLTGKRNLDIMLSGTGDACTVSVGGSYSGLVHNDKGDVFKRIEAAFTETSSSESPGLALKK